MAYRTEKTYCTWILDFIRFHKRKHPESMGPEEVDAWLSHLASKRNVAINTQKTALRIECSGVFVQAIFKARVRVAGCGLRVTNMK